jgi:hypothetical protein
MESSKLLLAAIDVLTDVAVNRRPPKPESVEALRQARLDLSDWDLDELAAEIIKSDMESRKSRRAQAIGE